MGWDYDEIERMTRKTRTTKSKRILVILVIVGFLVFLLSGYTHSLVPPLMKTLLIDNYDSFTFNLMQQMAGLDADVIVKKNDEVSIEDVERLKPDRIVISPGPGTPKESGSSLDIIRSFAGRIPILGVCLGHQCLSHLFDDSSMVIHASEVMHGKTSAIYHKGKGLFEGMPSPFKAARYHSLVIKRVPKDFELIAWTGSQTKPDVIMGIAHQSLPVFGVQFHPESFMTENGNRLMQNFLYSS